MNDLKNQNIAQLKSTILKGDKKTIVFELDMTLLNTIYKKNQVTEHDAVAYVQLFGHNTFKVL
jgi:hypothetical protein